MTRKYHQSLARGRTLRYAGIARGFTLIELMVAMLLGLIVIGGVVSVFIANQRTYRTNQALGNVQDGARVAFELMARDIRDAGLTGCSNSSRIVNVLNNGPAAGGTTWWADWNNSLRGFNGSTGDPATSSSFGTGAANRVAGTDSLMLLGGEPSGYTVKENVEPAATFTLNETSSDLQAGDVILVCDPNRIAITQISSVAAGLITHGTTGTPGNCTTYLGFPTNCGSSLSEKFQRNALMTRMRAADWYIGNNPAGGRSLYRVALVNVAGMPTPTAQEMVRDVTGLTIAYHQGASAGFVPAGSVSNWGLVNAVRVTFELESVDKRAGVDSQALKRTFTATTTVRNRVL